MKYRNLIGCACCLAVMLLLAARPGHAAEPSLQQCYPEGIRAVAKKIPLMVESSTEGVFIQLLDEAFRHLDFPRTIVAEPAKRATRDFESGHYDVLLPVVRRPNDPGHHLFTRPIFVRRDFAFVRENSPAPVSIAGLEGKRVLLTSQYRYSPKIMQNPKIEKLMGNDDIANMKALSRGRGDVFVVEELSGLRAAQAAGVSNYRYERAAPLSIVEIYMALHKDECGSRLQARLNEAITEVLASRFYLRAMGQDASW